MRTDVLGGAARKRIGEHPLQLLPGWQSGCQLLIADAPQQLVALNGGTGHVCVQNSGLVRRGRDVALSSPGPGLHEREHVASGVTAKALEQLLARADIERRRALVVQRTAASPAIRARSAQLGVLAGELDEIGRHANALLGLLAVSTHDQ